MRDEQTGTYWQQISGRAISGPLSGRELTLVSADELSFALWKKEQPAGTVLKDVPERKGDYAPRNWDARMGRTPTVIGYEQAGLKARDLMVGVHAFGVARAFPYERIRKEKLIQDNFGGEPIAVVLGPDAASVRVFRRRLPGGRTVTQFYLLPEGTLLDSETGTRWKFSGCAISGLQAGKCLDRINAIKDYWFDWRNYNPQTTVYGVRQPIR